MKPIIVVLLACLVALVSSASYMNRNVKYAETEFLEKQQFVFDILQHVHQNVVLLPKYKDGKDFDIQNYYDHYNHVELVKEFYEWHTKSPVPVGEIFTLFNEHHVEYAKRLVYAFVLAKDWDTFYKTVVWARWHVNKEVFVYALSIAVIHRTDLQGLVLPAIYEIFPYYFFNSETIQKAQHYKMQGFDGVKKVEGVYNVVIPSNYSGVHGQVNDENLVSYFTEDIGLNAFYQYYNLDYPYWTSGAVKGDFVKDRHGEFYFSVHQQLLARYYMERLSNSLTDIEEFNFNTETFPGYFSGLRYYSGVHFPDRENGYGFYHSGNFYNIDLVTLYSHRIYDVIDYNFALLPDGKHFELKDVKVALETLGNIVQGNKDSVNPQLYGSMDHILRDIINEGFPAGHHGEDVPGVMYHYSTSIRDPAFFHMYKFILRFYWRYLDRLPSYTKSELQFDGVKITGVEMDKLVTFFDKFYADITNAVDVEPYDVSKGTELYKFGRTASYDGHDFVIKARQQRLNHLPFTFKLSVSSTKPQKAVVKVMIGPKYDVYGKKIDINVNRKNFFELDYFLVDLVEGENVITRSSTDYSWYVNDRTTYYELYKKLFQAVNSHEKFPLDMSEAHCGFPSRLMLPKGKKGGMPFQFFFYVAPYHEPALKQFSGFDPAISCGIGSGSRYLDDTTLLYPLDRVIDVKNWYVDNMYYFDTMIFHKSEVDINAVQV
ncbi:unnamed protein product [Hermetia illucens]|uniref:Uncharacterized protein n=1 Tax=Hermetia illucens TaxID=343691 RepID=A0A7R8UR38_HERIL|nr:larval serum protein 2-like [Hermetia illucens]CAD7085090.1 unnamed protein product [Hermetia illucens]